jgi:transposase
VRMCDLVPMRTGVEIQLSPEDRARLEQLVTDRNTPQKHAWRAWIVLLSGDGVGTMEIMRRTGQSKPTVWCWQARFAAEGIGGLLRDKTRPPGRKPLAAWVVQQVVTKTTTETPPVATHWTARAMARAVGIAVSSVQKIWQAHGLKPHLVRRFKLSNDSAFAEGPADIAGFYMNPPGRALVLAVDEKSQVQALDRTQPGLPLKRGAERVRRDRHRPLCQAAPPSRVHPLPARHR